MLLEMQMRASTGKRIVFVLISILLICCCDNTGVMPINEDPFVPPEDNHIPILGQHPDTFAIVGDTLRFTFSATDRDDDALRFAMEIPCTWGEVSTGQCHPPICYINFRTGSAWFYPRTYDVPERCIMVTVTDEHGAYAHMDFIVSVVMAQERR